MDYLVDGINLTLEFDVFVELTSGYFADLCDLFSYNCDCFATARYHPPVD